MAWPAPGAGATFASRPAGMRPPYFAVRYAAA
ncbi:hypothetical protein M218_11500 [Burkholderia pseudomallei MSHR338]|nr:hypothetical protein M218_11500 [Burkholderia pseudomallei MSHR338]